MARRQYTNHGVKDVTGRRLDMLIEPNVRVLAEKLRASLDRVQVPQHEQNSKPSDLESQPASTVL
jgi:hypothetical protein